MPDAGLNYAVERRRLEIQKHEHQSTIQRGKSRLLEIALQKQLNLDKAELSNMELDGEADVIGTNNEALVGRMAEIDKQLALMVKEPQHG